MNREIKFRIYTKDMGMSKVVTLTELVLHPDHRWLTFNPIIMQYTGLKDKNNKEIYEGDILLTDFDDKVKVVFDSGCFFIEGNNLDVECCGLWEWSGDMSKVIGNIYENPELLEKINDE